DRRAAQHRRSLRNHESGASGGGQNRAEQHPIPIHPSRSPSPPRAIQNKLLIAISESRKSRRNSVHYPVNAGYNVAHTACPATIDARRAVLPVQGTQDDDRRASSKARIANLRRDSARRS